MVDKLFYYIDPFIAKSTEISAKFKIWKTFISNRTKTNEIWKCGTFKHSKQLDSYNCGVICIIFIDVLLDDIFTCNFDDNNLIEYREKLYQLLIDNEKK